MKHGHATGHKREAKPQQRTIQRYATMGAAIAQQLQGTTEEHMSCLSVHHFSTALGYALEHRPGEHARILDGFKLAIRPGAVRVHSWAPQEEEAAVASANQQVRPGYFLVTRHSCTCRAGGFHPETRCMHRWALLLTLAALQFAEEPTRPAPIISPQNASTDAWSPSEEHLCRDETA